MRSARQLVVALIGTSAVLLAVGSCSEDPDPAPSSTVVGTTHNLAGASTVLKTSSEPEETIPTSNPESKSFLAVYPADSVEGRPEPSARGRLVLEGGCIYLDRTDNIGGRPVAMLERERAAWVDGLLLDGRPTDLPSGEMNFAYLPSEYGGDEPPAGSQIPTGCDMSAGLIVLYYWQLT